MSSLRVIGIAVVVAVVLTECFAFFPLPRDTNNHKPGMKKSIDFLRLAKKRSEESPNSNDLLCYSCQNTDPTSRSCSGSVETCQLGEVCASIFHSDNTNMDGCLAATICDHLSKAEGIYALCCSTNFCNM